MDSVSYHVISQRHADELGPDLAFHPIVEVTFQLDSGEVATVKVPQRMYSPEYVREAIEDKARTMAGVRDLRGTVTF